MEDFDKLISVGKKFTSPGRTISEGDFTLLTNLTWTIDQIHSDREYMKHTQFGERILVGSCVLACTHGLANRSGISQALDNDKLRRVALLGFDQVRFTAAVKPGDTITVNSEIVKVRPTRNDPKRAVVTVKDTTFNQNGQEVMEAIRSILVQISA